MKANKKIFIILLTCLVLGGGFLPAAFAATQSASSGSVSNTAVATQPSPTASQPATPQPQPTPNQAKDPSYTSDESVTKISTWQANLLAVISGAILNLVASLINFAINLGNDLLNLAAVQRGWQIVLNFTNLGFILAIIVIAFATILQIENYGMKKTLAKLIIAALLVNFSLVIAGSIISLSNSVSGFFMKNSLGNQQYMANALSAAMQPQQFSVSAIGGNDNSNHWWNRLAHPISYGIKWLIQALESLVFIIFFTVFMVIVLAALAFMFLLRDVYLMFLVIVSPIVWLVS